LHSFLLELGIEELPDGVILPAIDYLKTSFEKMLQAENLKVGEIKTGSTPRRLSIMAYSLPEQQADAQITKCGPSVQIAYKEDGTLSPAGLGFLKKSGAGIDDIVIQKVKGKDVLAVSYLQAGKKTVDILKEWIPEAINQIPLPKKMIWDDPAFAFSRPVRWIVALWDCLVIPLNHHGIVSGRISYGNRYLGPDQAVEISSVQSYAESLKGAGVIVCRQERKDMISAQCEKLFAESDLQIMEDPRLLETVCNLVEYPTAVIGEFDPRFLAIPQKVISSTISQNQKYFSVLDRDQNPVNKFVFISNGDPRYSDKIRLGNEKVVAARLEDAAWFFEEDCKKPLSGYLEQLQDVVFQSRLGTMADKTQRITKLAAYISSELGLDNSATHKALRAAVLCKADLVTMMLGEKEFTKLQGYIGMQYALRSGEDPEVALAIYEHYMPRGSKDSLPQSVSGAICAIADKLDTVAGIIAVGLLPTGSADPFALRRAASGLVQIIADRAWELDLYALIDFCMKLLSESIEPEAGSGDYVTNFFVQRVSWLLKELGISYDVVAAVMHTGIANLPDLIGRAEALQALKSEENFIRLVLGFKRVSNIISGAPNFVELSPELFEEEAERELHIALELLTGRLDVALDEHDYNLALKDLIDIASAIDKFFDQVLVNCDNESLQQNRFALLALIRSEFLRVADLAQIVVEIDSNGE